MKKHILTHERTTIKEKKLRTVKSLNSSVGKLYQKILKNTHTHKLIKNILLQMKKQQ